MTVRQLAQLLLTARDLDKDVKISYRGVRHDITLIGYDGLDNFLIGTSGYDEDKLAVKTEIEVKSPHSDTPQIF